MTRSVNATTLAALASDSFRFCHLISIDFDTAVYVTDYTHDVTNGGNTYEAGGHLISIPDPQENRELRVGAITIQLSAVSKEYLSIFLNGNWFNREVVLKKAIIGDDGQVVGDPITIFQGLISQFQLDEADTSEIAVQVASHWADFERKSGRLTNNNSQQYFFAGDLGMEFAANTVKDIKWGRG